MRHKLAIYRPWLSRLFLILSAGWVGLAGATDVRFVGSVGYSHFSSIVVLNANQIRSYASLTSAPLRMELWATSAPFAGSFAGGHQLAAYGVGPIAAGASVQSVSSGGITWNEPPSGAWYVAMVLTEQSGISENSGYSPRNWLTFPDKITGSGPPPPDTTPPTVSISSPTSGNVSGTVTVSANASDNVGVARVDFYVNGGLVGSDSAAPYQYSWNTTTVANGAATLRAVAFDAAGNSTQSAIVNVNVANADTTPPTVSISSPTSGNVSGTVTVSANASDNVGVARVDFYVNGGLVGSDSAAPYQYSWNTTSLANGAATLRAVAFDAAGNSTQSAMVTVNVANGGPGLPPVLVSAMSRKAHGGAGTFDLPLSLVSTNPTTEPRQGPTQTIVCTFDKAITGANVTVTEGAATAGAPVFSGNNVIVTLTGVPDQQYVTISLSNVTSSDGGTNGAGSVRIGLLVGDVSGNRVVTVADTGLVNAQLAQPLTGANFLNDVNVSGMISVADKAITNGNLTKTLPAP